MRFPICFLFIGLCWASDEKSARKSKFESEHNEAADSHSCSVSPRGRVDTRYHLHTRFPRSSGFGNDNQDGGHRFGTAFYFNGSEKGLRLAAGNQIERNTPILPRLAFTVEIWIKPEGGQPNPALILDVSDYCGEDRSHFAWQIGIETRDKNGGREAHIYFSLQTEMSLVKTQLWSQTPYTAKEWVHVAGTYSGETASLFINGARVASSHKQVGPIFSELRSSCKILYLARQPVAATNSQSSPLWNSETCFRGSLDQFRLWNKAMTHKEIVELMYAADVSEILPQVQENLLISDSFDNFDRWTLFGKTSPKVVESDISQLSNDMPLKAPPCGQTVCDDPRIIESYIHNWELRQPKTVRYQVITILQGDGTNSCVTAEQTRNQHVALQKAFRPYNISWELELIELQSTALRRKTIIFGCDSRKIGNKQCNLECRHPITGNDGGDCDETIFECDPTLLQNNKCDPVCNRPEHKWDNGQCCNASNPDVHKTCIDPESPLRGYIGIDEYKKILNFSNERALTVKFAEWSNSELIGLSTFPWEKEVYSIYGDGHAAVRSSVITVQVFAGGIVLQPDKFGKHGHRDNLIHEIGHALGLWHVHHGVSEMSCNDPCRETEPSLLTGDMAADTNPTPKNMHCRNPSKNNHHYYSTEGAIKCANDKMYENTPFDNYMSYADEGCSNHFTPHQVARMHCYLDLKYKGWIVNPNGEEEGLSQKSSHVIPLPPKLSHVSHNPSHAVTLVWIPPLGHNACRPVGSTSGHAECSEDGRVIQYAARAHSPGPFKLSGYWAPHQATGPPDAESCEASTKAWLPDMPSCEQPENCMLTLEPDIPLPVESLSLWVAWNAENGVEEMNLKFTDGSKLSFKHLTAYCDIPYTVQVNKNESLTQIEIFTTNPFVSIDSIELVSSPGQAVCQQCDQLVYRVHRNPEFNFGPYVETNKRTFTDRDVEHSTIYAYSIVVMNGTRSGDPSPPLVYAWNQSFCGDGMVDVGRNEGCDDGNSVDGDGCSITCSVEKGFRCQGEPSLCYVYAGDGVCEDFEIANSVADCGHYTPPRFEDQWAMDVVSSTKVHGRLCHMPTLIGPPKSSACSSSSMAEDMWDSCDPLALRSLELTASFQKPAVATSILVHLSADGISDLSTDPKFLRLDLVDTDNQTHPIKNSEDIFLSCSNNPVEFKVFHDLSIPLFYTKAVHMAFSSPAVQIQGLRMRSWKHIDPVNIQNCANSNQLYQPMSKQCVENQCSQLTCRKPSVPQGHLTDCTDLTVPSGGYCNVQCDPGYRMTSRNNGEKVTESRIMCFNGEWNRKVECQPLDCGKPRIPHGKVICSEGTTFGKQCRFSCIRPANMKGSESVVTCGHNGVWSVPEAYCHVSCPAPKKLSRKIKAVSKQCRLSFRNLDQVNVNFPVGSKCKFICVPGYHVERQSIEHRLFRMECSDSGKWDGPKCVRIKCPEPKIIYYGSYNCTNGYNLGSECSFFCPGTKQMRISKCRSDGSWSNTEPCRLPRVACRQPVTSRDFHVQCPMKLFAGASCKIRCAYENYDPVVEHMVTTDRGFKMQVLQKVPRISCTAQTRWEPDVYSLNCVKQCNQEFMGDGWCDFQNNRGYCNWDGGDCCASTSRGGKVRLMFPSLCNSHLCRCLNPYAVENRNDLQRARFEQDKNSTDETSTPQVVDRPVASKGSARELRDLMRSYRGVMSQIQESKKNRKPSRTRRRLNAKETDRDGEVLPKNMEELADWLNDTMTSYDDESKFLLLDRNSTHVAPDLTLVDQIFKQYKQSQSKTGAMMKRYFWRIRSSILRALKEQYKRLQVKS